MIGSHTVELRYSATGNTDAMYTERFADVAIADGRFLVAFGQGETQPEENSANLGAL